MKEFDIEAAKNGAPVQTRDGKTVRIICWDKKDSFYPIVALYGEDGKEWVETYTLNGKCDLIYDNPRDLVMAQDKETDRKTVLQRLHDRAKKMAYSEELIQYEGVSLKADNSFEFGYMVGAYQQAEIEIDKACEWLEEQLYTDDGGCLASDFYQQLDDFLAGFRKAMEE